MTDISVEMVDKLKQEFPSVYVTISPEIAAMSEKEFLDYVSCLIKKASIK